MNPFTPGFGQFPYQLAGRNEIFYDLDYAYNNAPGDPSLTSIIIGARGTGKTALLSYYSNKVRSMGWISVDTVCQKGFLDDIYQQTVINTKHIIESNLTEQKSKIIKSKFDFLGIGFEIEKETHVESQNWRIKMSELIECLSEQDIGLLITIDEVNPKLEDMIFFASVYQLFIREGKKIAVLMAGLPYNVSVLLQHKQVSFLRRASQFHIKGIDDFEIKKAFEETFKYGGMTIEADALDYAVKEISGFPYMMQLIGYRAFRIAENEHKDIVEKKHIMSAVDYAINDLQTQVLKNTVDELSNVEIKFLNAMCEDEEFSFINDISKRLDKSASYIGAYKKKLLEHGVIEEIGRGRIKFALPYLREYIKKDYYHISIPN